MFTKLTCEKGKIFLYTDINQKIETVNSLNIIDIAEVNNKIELLEHEKSTLYNEIVNNKINIKNAKINSIIFIAEYLLLMNFHVFKELFLILINYSPIFLIAIISIYVGIPIYILNNLLRIIPKEKNNLYANSKTLEFVDKTIKSIQIEKEKISCKPKLSLIREGQEFAIKNGEELHYILNVVNSYYYDKNNIDDYIINLKQENKTDEEIISLFYDFAKDNAVPLTKKEIVDLLNIVYSCMEEDSKLDINIKKKN